MELRGYLLERSASIVARQSSNGDTLESPEPGVLLRWYWHALQAYQALPELCRQEARSHVRAGAVRRLLRSAARSSDWNLFRSWTCRAGHQGLRVGGVRVRSMGRLRVCRVQGSAVSSWR